MTIELTYPPTVAFHQPVIAVHVKQLVTCPMLCTSIVNIDKYVIYCSFSLFICEVKRENEPKEKNTQSISALPTASL